MPGAVWEREGPALECVKFLGSSGSLRLRAQPYTSPLARNSLRGRGSSVPSPHQPPAALDTQDLLLAPPASSLLPCHSLPEREKERKRRKEKEKGVRKILESDSFQGGNTLQTQLIKHQTDRFPTSVQPGGKLLGGKAGKRRKDSRFYPLGKRLNLRG